MIKRIRNRKFERFMNPSDEVLDVFDELISTLKKEKDLVMVNGGVAGDGVVFADKYGYELIVINGDDKKVTVRTVTIYGSKTEDVLRTKEDLEDWLKGQYKTNISNKHKQ